MYAYICIHTHTNTYIHEHTHTLVKDSEWKYPECIDKAAPRSPVLLLGVGHLHIPTGQGAMRASDNNAAAAVALGCPPWLSGKTLTLKTPHTLVAKDKKLKLELV